MYNLENDIEEKIGQMSVQEALIELRDLRRKIKPANIKIQGA